MSTIVPLQNSSFHLEIVDRDLLRELLRDTRSPATRRAYAVSLTKFFRFISSQDPSPQLVSEFLNLEKSTALKLVLTFKASLIERGLAEATVNNRLAGIKALVIFAEDQGKCIWNLKAIKSEKVVTYRDTSGVTANEYNKVIAICDRTTLKGKRDYSLLRLLWDNALRCDEICKTRVKDFDPYSQQLAILGKGRGTQKQSVDLSDATTEAIANWLAARSDLTPESPLYIALDRAHFGQHLMADGLNYIINTLAKRAGTKKTLSPHKCRHSSITAYLKASNGDLQGAQDLARHSDPKTTMIYNDNRLKTQGKATKRLANLIH